MHFAVIAPPLRGHYLPLSHLAAELMGRGHRVTFVHHPDTAALVEAPGAAFVPIGNSLPAVSRWTAPMSRIRGILGLGSVFGGMVRFTDMFCREAPDVLRRIRADAVIADQVEAGGGLVAEHLGLPWVSVAVTLPINREMSIPPPYVSWRYMAGEKGLRRNRGGWRVADFLLRGVNRAIARNARMLGLPRRSRLEDCLSPCLQLSQTVPGVDFPRRELPSCFRHVGPLKGPRAGSISLPRGDDRPLVYCTLGTLQGSRSEVFRKVADACAQLDLRLLMTHGGLGDRAWAEDLPGRPMVFDWVPQEAVLREADMVVCHGGMNSVLDALAAGLPMVIMPLAFEQSAVAARLEHAGVARVVSPRASSRRLAEAIAEVRRNPVYRERAGAVRRQILEAGGALRAADLIEATLGSRA